MELYAAAGMDFVRELLDQGKDVFLDHEVLRHRRDGEARRARGGAERSPVPDGARQQPVMRAAVKAAATPRTKLLAVTVLTSFDQQDLRGYGIPVRHRRPGLAARAQSHGGGDGRPGGSPLEAAAVRAQAGTKSDLVTPGVRSGGASSGDQKRVATPAEAIRDGADYVVMGRQMTRAADPAAEAARVAEEIAEAARAAACP